MIQDIADMSVTMTRMHKPIRVSMVSTAEPVLKVSPFTDTPVT